jgi:hypothetical protein
MKHTEDAPEVVEARKVIEGWRAEAAEYRREKNPGMAKMLSGDAMDLQKVVTRYKRGQYWQAALIGCNMDTCPRESIPEKIWQACVAARSG